MTYMMEKKNQELIDSYSSQMFKRGNKWSLLCEPLQVHEHCVLFRKHKQGLNLSSEQRALQKNGEQGALGVLLGTTW